MKLQLRCYQEKSLKLMRQAYSDGKRKIMLFLATGGGKSVIFISLIASLLDGNKKVILVMRRKQLVEQAYKHFKKWGIDASVIMAKDKRFDKTKRLQICSIDTVARRDIDFLLDFDSCVVDECHDTTSPKYQSFLNKLNCDLFIGLTATPFPIGNKVHDFWEACVKPIEMHTLRKMGYLVPCRVLVPSDLDLSGIKTMAGDYHQGQLADTMSDSEIIGDIVNTYIEQAQNKSAILFAVNKEHSMEMAESFNLVGIPAIHCDESTKQKDRDESIDKLRTGEIKVLCNVNIFSTGVDIPEAEVGIMARPTKSEVLYIQQIGRLLRPYRKCGKCSTGYDNSEKCPVCGYAGAKYIKQEALILDHGNNISRFGSPYKVRQPAMVKEDIKERKKEDEESIKTKICKNCFAAFLSHLSGCPYCGHSNEKIQRTIKRTDGKLVPYDEYAQIKERWLYYERLKLERGFKKHFPFFKLYEEFGDVIMLYDELKIPKWIPKIVEKSKAEKEKGIVYR